MPPITLWFLQGSRSIRIAWLLEELNLDYTVKFFNREEGKAPQAFKDGSRNPIGKAPTIQDGDLTVYESGAITEYLCETYDKDHRLIPTHQPHRIQVQQWLHAAEATFVMHSLAIAYARWNVSEAAKSSGELTFIEKNLSGNVQTDLDWLDAELGEGEGRFLVGDQGTAADIMMQVSIAYALHYGLGTEGRKWANVERWMRMCEGTETYLRAVEKTGFKL